MILQALTITKMRHLSFAFLQKCPGGDTIGWYDSQFVLRLIFLYIVTIVRNFLIDHLATISVTLITIADVVEKDLWVYISKYGKYLQ